METIGEFEYSKKDLIGHGAFAVVFKGKQKKKHDLTVAIKCITKKNLAKSQNLLSKEIKILKELSGLHHDNVVALLDCKETSHHVYLVMEYCNGGDLADYLQAKGTLSEDTIALFLRQIAGAMKALNAKGVVHRDLKPQNILLNHSGKFNPQPSDIQLKIADFGFARFLQDGVMAATLCGSPMYMAPEVIMSIQYDAKADLWSIGTIVYQCLTGKAPFQAQTPQQLKQFYEKNANLSPNIPSGTSAELRALLVSLLKRNAKDRIEFDAFYRHPFLSTGLKQKSSPVPVPRSRSRTSMGESPSIKTVTASPLSGHVPMSSAHSSGDLPKIAAMGVDVGSPREVAGFLNVCKMEQDPPPPRPGSPSAEDYVMVPENLPSDHSVGSAGSSHKAPGSVDLNTIFSDNSTSESPQQPSTKTESADMSPSEMSPSRPNSLPVQSPSTAKASTPIPVPSQSYRMSPASPVTPNKGNSPHSPHISGSGSSLAAKQNLSRKSSNSSLPSVGSMSPPAVQFTIGTPPSTSWARRGSLGTPPSIRAGTTSPAPGSPLRRVGTAPLPTIMGSPTKNNSHIMFPMIHHTAQSPVAEPLQVPFGNRTRTVTCPENMTAFPDDNRCIVPMNAADRCATVPDALFRGNNNNPIPEHLIRAAFATSPGITQQEPSRHAVVPYTASHRGIDIPASPRRAELGSGADMYGRTTDSPPAFVAHSPPNMEGPISFVAPELVEETLMEKEHNETLAKLNFVHALVDCVMDLAQSRASPISESFTQKQGEAFTLDRVAFSSEEQRCLEQLVLYMRALQLLSSAFLLAREEVKAVRLQPSNNVKSVLKLLKVSYHKCLLACKQLNKDGLINSNTAAVTADRLIYAYALEMCQTAALDEIFGNPHECFKHYRSAQILLHSLAQQAQDTHDRILLNQYKESVEKRLFNLYNQGFIQS